MPEEGACRERDGPSERNTPVLARKAWRSGRSALRNMGLLRDARRQAGLRKVAGMQPHHNRCGSWEQTQGEWEEAAAAAENGKRRTACSGDGSRKGIGETGAMTLKSSWQSDRTVA